MKKTILICMLLLSVVATAQVKKKKKRTRRYQPKPALKVDAKELEVFGIEGYETVTYAYGDFNGDNRYDAVLLLKKTDEETLSKTETTPVERPLLVLLRGNDGKLKLKVRNDRAVYCYKCGSEFGSPITDILIEGNQFTIQHESGKADRWTRLISFQYDMLYENFSLVKDATSTYSLSEVNKVENNVKTKKDFGHILFEEFDVYAKDLKLKKV